MHYHWNWLILFEASPDGAGSYLDTLLNGLQWTLITALSAWCIALLLGIFIGVFENLVGGYIAPLFKEIAGFLLILVILMVRPFGLFGQRDIERV